MNRFSLSLVVAALLMTMPALAGGPPFPGFGPGGAATYGDAANALSAARASLQPANALSELVAAGSQAAARANLGLGTAAVRDTGSAAGQVALTDFVGASVAAEAAIARMAEQANASNIAANATAIGNEVTRAKGAEATNASAISANATAITSEVATARQNEATNATAAANALSAARASLQPANALSELAAAGSQAAARANLGLGTAATQNVGPGGVASYGDGRITGAVQSSTLGQPNGAASLGSTGMVPSGQLPIGTAGGVVGVGGDVSSNTVTVNSGAGSTTLAYFAAKAAAAVPASQLGFAAGNVMGPLGNFNGSGYPSLPILSRFIMYKQAPTASDYINFQFYRDLTNLSGGGGALNQAFRIDTIKGSSTNTNEWAHLAVCTTSATTAGGCVGSYGEGVRKAGSDSIWGLIGDSIDSSGTASTGKAGTIGAELDVEADAADNAFNSYSIGNAGNRVALQLVGVHHSSSITTPTEFAHGIWLTSSTPNGPVFWDDLFGGGVGTQVRNVIDTRAFVAPTGATNPVGALVMSAGQMIDFNGGSSPTSAPGASLMYANGAITGSVPILAPTLTSTGAVNAPGVASPNATLTLATSGGTGLTVQNAASAVNSVSVTGSATGADPVIGITGSDGSRNLQIKAAGSGGVYVGPFMAVGTNSVANFVLAGGPSSASILASGGIPNIPLNVSGKGTSPTNLGSATSPAAFPGHVLATGSVPALSSCGTSPTISGSDNAGLITTGTGATSCTATFATAYAARPYCTVTGESASVTYSVTKTAITIAAGAGVNIDYQCAGQAGG